MTEFVDHLHEHFVDPCVVVDGRYTLSTEPGCGARMHDASIARYEFPSGSYWRERPIG